MTTVATPDPQIINRRDGVDAYGIFLNYVMYHPDTGVLEQEFRYFLADKLVCKYARTNGSKRAAWNAYECTDHEAAVQMLHDAVLALPQNNVVQLHKALIVELTAADISSMHKTPPEAPIARFAGGDQVQKVLGKIDDATWRPKGWAGS